MENGANDDFWVEVPRENGAKDGLWVEDSREQLLGHVKSKRKVRSKKMEFDGWGSKRLIEFLKSLGIETGEQLSQHKLTAIVNDYVNKKNLLHPIKKKRVVCDEWLNYLFGKKWVSRIKIYDLLEPHFAENHDESEDEDAYSSEEENEMTVSRNRKTSNLDKKVTPVKVSEAPKSCFASIIPGNIKLVYLRRSLVQELLKDPESFEAKVVGSFVRIKSDPNDYSQKNSHQLQQVTGIRKDSECGDASAEFFLQVPTIKKEIHISDLSDENFKEEECEDLCHRIMAGSIRRPTVVELQQKVQLLHEDITKQWLVKELSLLQNLIDRANEKGWRRELFEYLERKELLQKPSEQTRLLLEVPNVIAEELEPEATLQNPAEDEKQEISCSPKSLNGGTSVGTSLDMRAAESLSNHDFGSIGAEGYEQDTSVQPLHTLSSQGTAEKSTECRGTEPIQQVVKNEEDSEYCTIDLNVEGHEEVHKLGNAADNNGSLDIEKKLTEPQVIELSDDDEAVDQGNHNCKSGHSEAANLGDRGQTVGHPETTLWFYTDPRGQTQGPFPLTSLKRWKEDDYFPPGFQVWKRGDCPVLLEDVIRQMFPN